MSLADPASVAQHPAPYQLLPLLADDQLADLRASIAMHGVLEPIVVDEHGVIIDGHHRKKIADQLGVPCPTRTVTGFTPDQKRDYALTVNLDRRHLTREQRAELHRKLRDEGRSTRCIAEVTKTSQATVARDVRSIESSDSMPKRVVASDGRSYPASRPKPEPKPMPTETRERDSEIAKLLHTSEDEIWQIRCILSDDQPAENLKQQLRDGKIEASAAYAQVIASVQDDDEDQFEVDKRELRILEDALFQLANLVYGQDELAELCPDHMVKGISEHLSYVCGWLDCFEIEWRRRHGGAA